MARMTHSRLFQGLYLAATLFVCWFGFMAVHELGHVLAAVVSGGRISQLVLHPFSISRTDLSVNPAPLTVTWMGPLLGCMIPTTTWWLAASQFGRQTPSGLCQHLQFFAGFCLVANGVYIGAGSFTGVGDCGDMLKNGTPIWLMWLFGVLAISAGMFTWHRLGSIRIFLASPGQVNRVAGWICIGLAGLLVVVGLCC